MAKGGAPTEEKMQKVVDQVCESCDSNDLTISIERLMWYITAKKKKKKKKKKKFTRSLPSQGKVNDCKW